MSTNTQMRTKFRLPDGVLARVALLVMAFPSISEKRLW
jgi:hypothetical protein